jgi:hypothetical protein
LESPNPGPSPGVENPAVAYARRCPGGVSATLSTATTLRPVRRRAWAAARSDGMETKSQDGEPVVDDAMDARVKARNWDPATCARL